MPKYQSAAPWPDLTAPDHTPAPTGAFSQGWLVAQRRGEVTSDYHMNLLAWSSSSPFHVLAIILNLIDSVGGDESAAEQIALGPVQWLFDNAPDPFASVLQDAIADHSGFALFAAGRDGGTKPHTENGPFSD